LKIPLGVPASQAGNDARDDDEVPRLPGEAIEPGREVVPGLIEPGKGGRPRRPRHRA
jgi:hypothetical protein